MKKILFLLSLFLLIPNLSYGDLFLNKCGSVSKDNNVEILADDARAEYYINFNEGKVYYTHLTSRKLNEIINKTRENFGASEDSRTQNEVYNITFIDKKILTAEFVYTDDYNSSIKKEIEINFKSNRVSTFYYGLNDLGKKVVAAMKKGYEQIGGRPYGLVQCINENLDDGDGSSGSSGTAFFISNKGHLITNNHVIEDCKLSKVSFNNKDYDAKLIATDKTLDLALLKANIRSSTYFSFSNKDANKLNKIYVAGFPLGKGLSDDLKISSGIVSALKGFEDNSNEIQIDAPINPGNSGGPIINESGELVAIAVSGLAKDQTEGINFGIKSSAAESFLNANKIKPKKSLYSRKLNNNKLLDILEKGTVYTYCD